MNKNLKKVILAVTVVTVMMLGGIQQKVKTSNVAQDKQQHCKITPPIQYIDPPGA